MGIPAGTEYIIPVYVNKKHIGGYFNNFTYQIDLTPYRSTVNKFINTRDNICVYDVDTDSIKAKQIESGPFADGYLLIIWLSNATYDYNKTFYICFGKSINNNGNDISCFSTPGYTHYWCMNDFGSTIYNNYGYVNGTVSGNVTSRNIGLYGWSVGANETGNGNLTFTNEVIGTGNKSIEFVIKTNDTSSHTWNYIMSNNKFGIRVRGDTRQIQVTSVGDSTWAYSDTNAIKLGVWQHVCIARASDGTTNIYVDGKLSGAANQATGTPVAGDYNLTLLNYALPEEQYSYNGYIDELGIMNYAEQNWKTGTRAKMFENEDFYQIGDKNIYSNQLSSGLSIGF